jgi:hypothetical protein
VCHHFDVSLKSTMSTIHVTSPSGTQSQHEENQMRSMWEQGLLQEGTQYWKDGMSEWRPLSEYFQPTTTGSSPPPMMAVSTYSYTKDPQSLTSFVVFMLWVSLASEVVFMLADFGQMSLLGGTYTEAEAAANDSRQSVIGLAYLGVFIVTSIAFLKWIHRANLNCRGFGAQAMKFTPGWSVGYFFIPFLNLVRPYQAMKEIWKVSENPSAWQSASTSALLGWWWALWLISGFLGQMVFRTSMNATTIDQLQATTGLSIFSSFVGIPLCLVAINLIKSIAGMQERVVKSG